MVSNKNREFLTVVALTLAVSVVALGGPKLPDFSGTYMLVGKNKKEAGSITTLKVTQTADEIRFVRTEGGKSTTSFFELNAGEGEYVTPGGVSGKGKATAKGKDLVLDSTAFVAPQQGKSPTRLHTKQRWQLSPDAKTLTIHFDVDFPDMQILNGMMNQSWAEKYVRAND
ncbi:MAG: hypothetical protein ACJ71Q_09975 [Terriglobales bacterium]